MFFLLLWYSVRIRPQLVFSRVRFAAHSFACMYIYMLVYTCVYACTCVSANLCPFFPLYLFLSIKLLICYCKKCCRCECMCRVCMHVVMCHVYMCVCASVCVRARARDSHGIVMDPYDVARLFPSTNKRKGEKDREEKRIETSWTETRTYCLPYPATTCKAYRNQWVFW